MTTYCPYCGTEMVFEFGETNDFYYSEADEATFWPVRKLWACYQCPGPEE